MADEEVTAPAAAEEVEVKEMGVLDALKQVLKTALVHDGLSRGLHECAKALDQKQAKLCCLATDCDNPEYTKLVRALCEEGGVHLLMVDTGKQLGEYAGLCKLNEDGEAVKVVRCSCAVVTEFGEESQAHAVLTEFFKNQK
jgi:small subunit ribosomal protein S12e